MASGNSLLVSTSILLIVASCVCLEIRREYFEETYSILRYDEFFIIEALSRLGLSDVDRPEQVLEKLKSYRGSNRKHIQLYINLGEPAEDCGGNFADYFIKLYSVAEKSTNLEHKRTFLNFMEHYGGLWIDECAPRALGEIESAKDNERLADGIRFFKRAIFLDENASDRDLYRRLRLTSALDADWNVDFLASEARDYDTKADENKQLVRDKYHYLFVSNCRNVNDLIFYPLKTINLANILKPEAKYFSRNDRLKSLNEIGRICLDVWRSGLEFYENLSKNIGLRQKVLIPIAMKIGIQSRS